MKKSNDTNWPSIIFIIGYHALMLALLPVYLTFFTPSALLLGLSGGLLLLTGLSITAGYHRLFSHSTYKVNRFVEWILLFFGSMATQGSALRWSYDHRLHHAHIDKDDDPYSVKKGFWYAHLFWMFEKQGPMSKKKVIADLLRNKAIVFQNRFYEICMIATNLLAVIGLGLITGDFFGAFVFGFLVRLFFLHHFTWFINSLAHYWGHQNYSTEHSAVDNYILCFLTFGEGYHNYHHTFANDYRNGIRWYHFDPTKWLIWGLSKIGLASNLRKANSARVSGLMIEEHKRALLSKLKNSLTNKKDELEKKVSLFTESLTAKITELQKLGSQYKAAKQGQIETSARAVAKEINALKKHLKREWKEWRKLSKYVFKLPSKKLAVA